jgi:hypothetical protein
MQDPRNLSWNQFNESRRFPLLFDCNPVSTDGHFTLPDDLIVGMYISYSILDRLADPVKFYIKKFIYYHTGFTLEVYYASSPEEIKLAEITIDLTAQEIKNNVAVLLGFDTAFLYGYIVIGSIAGLQQQPAGEWEFTPAATTLDPFCIRPVAKELSALYVRNGDKTIGPFTGEITLVAGNQVTLDVRTVSDLFNCLENPVSNTGTEVVIHTDDTEEESSCVRTINGVKPDVKGNIDFTGKECLTILQSGEHTLEFSDKCAKPCCTCTELVPIEQAIDTLKSSVLEVESRLATMALQISFMSQAFQIAQ